MINFKFYITNIFKKPKYLISTSDWYHKLPFERSVEISYGRMDNNLASISLSTDFKGRDHAGPRFELTLFGYGVGVDFPKGRHWNYEKNCWLENYNVWMKEAKKYFEIYRPLCEFDAGNFSELYEEGNTPEEAVQIDEKSQLSTFEDYFDELVEIVETINPKCNIIVKDIIKLYEKDLYVHQAASEYIKNVIGK
ncbi:MAG: hypothetical protein [Caudoviricetes sp.]|nr:MAG: hypothetical protein [Caudoviricetes sp.]